MSRLARAALEQQLGHEPALGADRNDDRVLDLLRLGQAENLGAKVLRPARPADAAARDPAETQVHAFDPGGINEDLAERSRQRHGVEPTARQPDGDTWLAASTPVGSVQIVSC